MVESTEKKEEPQPSAYSVIFERKVNEIFTFLEVDPKKSLRLITKEIDTRAKKIEKHELLQLQVIKGVVLEKCVRVAEARDTILGVLNEIEQHKILDHYLLDTLQRSAS